MSVRLPQWFSEFRILQSGEFHLQVPDHFFGIRKPVFAVLRHQPKDEIFQPFRDLWTRFADRSRFIVNDSLQDSVNGIGTKRGVSQYCSARQVLWHVDRRSTEDWPFDGRGLHSILWRE